VTDLDIDDWRKEIDDIDEKLVELLNQRSQCAIEIGRLKRERALPIYSPDREAEVLSLVVKHNGGPLEPDAIRRLFERIIDEARRIERLAIEREAETRESGRKTRSRGGMKTRRRKDP